MTPPANTLAALRSVPSAPLRPDADNESASRVDETALGEGEADESGEIAPSATTLARLQAWTKSVNICLEDDFDLSDSELDAIGARVKREYDIDEESRHEWLEKNHKAMQLARQVSQEKQYPWPKASNVIWPLITTAAIQFHARAYPAVVAGRHVVKGVVVGADEGIPVPIAPLQSDGATGALSPPSPVAAPPQGVLPPQSGSLPPQIGSSDSPAVQQWIEPPGFKQARADRIGDHMSWQVLEEQTEWEPEMDLLLLVLPIVGCEFKKSYFDAEKKRNASLRVAAEHLVVNYHAKSMERAPRLTEEVKFYPIEIEELIRADIWLDLDGLTRADGESDHDAGDDDAPVHFLEQHRWLDLDDDGYKEPYIVTIHKESSRVVRIVARYDVEGIQWNATKGRIQKIEPVHYYTKYDFLPNPDGGIYGIGFGQLLGPMNESINSTLNMLMDAGHLANTQGGFIGRGLSMNAGAMRFQPGEYKTINAPGGMIRDNIVQLKFDGPSPVLFELLKMLIDAGREVAAVKDVLTGETPGGNTPATTILATIEQGLKVFSAIYKRIHRSLKHEFDKLYRLNRIYLDKEASYKVGNEWKSISQADYEQASGVEPYSDPTMVSDMQRLGRAQFLLQFVSNPLCDPKEILTRAFEAASENDIAKLFAPAAPPNPVILAKAMELHTKQAEMESQAKLNEQRGLLAMAQAIQSFATADKLVGDAHIAWVQGQLGSLQASIDMQAQGAAPAPVPMPGAPIPTQGDPHPLPPDNDAAVGVNTKGKDYTVRLGNET